MKLIIISLMLVSLNSFARQYIQCADNNSWDRAVVNLNGDNSTLFMTNGVHLPDEDRVEVLKKLTFKEKTLSHHIYVTNSLPIIDVVKVPNDFINVYASNFEVVMGHTNTNNGYTSERTMYCFSALYDQ